MDDWGNRPENKITESIIGAAIEVHRELGPGLLESVYEQCLCYELSLRGLKFQQQVPLPVRYKEVLLSIVVIELIYLSKRS
jgi:GxxExxY protein